MFCFPMKVKTIHMHVYKKNRRVTLALIDLFDNKLPYNFRDIYILNSQRQFLSLAQSILVFKHELNRTYLRFVCQHFR